MSQKNLKHQLTPFNRGLGCPVSRFSFFFSFASSFRIYMKNKEKNVPVSRSWKLKVKLLAITGNMFTLAFWLTGCLWILYKIKPVFFEEFVIENPVHDTLHTSISEVWKNPQNPYFQPRTKAVEDYSWLCNWRFRFHHCLFYFSFGFSWNKTFFSGQKKVSVSVFFFPGDSIPNFQTLTVHEDPAQAILEESMCLKYKSCF